MKDCVIARSRRAGIMVVLCGLLFLVLIPTRSALAGGSNDPECPFEDPEDCAVWYAAQDYGATPTTPPVQGAPAVTTVTKHIINLGSQSLVRAYQGVLDAMVAGSIGHLETELRPGFSFGFSTILQYSSAGLAGVGFFGNNLEATTYTIWTKVLAVAGAFFPLLIVANIARVYTSGASAPVVRAEMFQSLIFSLGRFALAGASYWLGNQVLKIGWGVAGLIADLPLGAVSGIDVAQSAVAALTTAGVAALSAILIPGGLLLFFYIFLFFVFLALLLVSTLALSHYAFVAIVIMFIALAPLVIVIGGLPNFEWVYRLWLKLGTGVILLPIANVVLLRLAFIIFPWLSGEGSLRLVNAFVFLGIIGVLISVNFAVGKFVFGPVLEAAKSTRAAVQAVREKIGQAAGLALAAAGVPGGGLVGGLGSRGSMNPAGGSPPQSGAGAARLSGDEGATPRQVPGRTVSTRPAMPRTLSGRAAAGALSTQELARLKGDQRTRQEISRALVGQDPVLRAAATAFAGPVQKEIAAAEAQLAHPAGAMPATAARQVSAPVVATGGVKQALFGQGFASGVAPDVGAARRVGWQAGDQLVEQVVEGARQVGLTAHTAALPDQPRFYGALSAYAVNDIISQQLAQGGFAMQIDRAQARETLTAGASALAVQGNREGAAMVHAFIQARDALGPAGAATLGALFADVRARLD